MQHSSSNSGRSRSAGRSTPENQQPAPRATTVQTSSRLRDPDEESSSTRSPSPKRNRRQPEDPPIVNAMHGNVFEYTLGLTRSPQDYIAILTEYIEKKTSDSEAVPSSSNDLSAFYGISIPDIKLQDYITRIFVYAFCSPIVFIFALVLMERAASKHPELRWTVSNIHRLLLASVIVATKIVDDRLYTMAYYSRVGGVPTTKETLRLELIFLRRIDNDIHVSHKDFNEMWAKLRKVRDEIQERTRAPEADTSSTQSVSNPATIKSDISTVSTDDTTVFSNRDRTMEASTSSSAAGFKNDVHMDESIVTDVVATSDEKKKKTANFRQDMEGQSPAA